MKASSKQKSVHAGETFLLSAPDRYWAPNSVIDWKELWAVVGQRYRAVATLGYTYAVSGERSKARQALAELQEMARHRYASPVDFAAIYTGLGEKDQAFAWLEKGFQRRVNRRS